MSLQNRVDPFGAIHAVPDHGVWMGNRGILHDEHRRLGASRWKTKAWIICRTDFQGRRRVPMTPGRYTELFFLDEATALAAGHRPCAECRREDFVRFREAFAHGRGIGGRLAAKEMDRILHAARVTRSRLQIRHQAEISGLPDGAFVLGPDDRPWRVGGANLHRWSFAGYDVQELRPSRGAVTVLTPAPTVAALAAGYVPAP